MAPRKNILNPNNTPQNLSNIIYELHRAQKRLDILEQNSGTPISVGLQQVLDTDTDWEQGPNYYAFNPDGVDIYLQDEEGNNNMEVYNGVGGNMGMYNDKIIDDTRLFESVETRNTGIANDIRKILRLFTYSQDALTFLYSYVNVLTLNTDKGVGIEARLNPSDLAPITAWLRTDNLIEDQTFQFPNESGTLALEKPFKIYKALVSQSGTSDPSVIELENTLGETPVFARTNVGVYSISSPGGLFLEDKTVTIVGASRNSGNINVQLTYDNSVELFLETANAADGTYQDGALYRTLVQIEIYN